MKTALKHLLLLTSLTIALALCLTVSASAAGDWYETSEDGAAVRQDGESGAALMAWGAEQDPSLPQLTPPRDPKWGIDYPKQTKILEDGSQDQTQAQVPGMASWSMGQLSQNKFVIELYRVNPDANPEQGELIQSGGIGLKEKWVAEGNVWSTNDFLADYQETGDYYFIVFAEGDGETYRDSEGVKSPLWHFDDPGVRLPTPAAPVWDPEPNEEGEPVVHYDTGDPDAVYGYMVHFYYAPDLDTEPQEVGAAELNEPVGEDSLYEWARSSGAGYYYATIQYLSRDITKAQCSEESPMSEPLYISEFYGGSADTLGKIIESVDENGNGIDEAVANVRQLDTGKLAEAMWADQDNTGAAGQIMELEELADNGVFVNVSGGVPIDQNGVSMIGAGLNVSPGEDVTLKITPPDDKSGVIPSMYHNAVQFSMNVTGNNDTPVTEEGGLLAVPIKLTLPIPAGINPNFLVLMHRHSDGSYEELSEGSGVYVHQENGKWYATFMVRSFSEFILAQRTELKAEKTDGGVNVTVNADPKGRSLTAALAVYNKDGKQLGVSLVDLADDLKPQFVSCDASAAHHVRVMILDNWKPAETARTVNVT